MLTLEEYIAKRKKEDGLNEFDMNNRLDNLRICNNYVFEFFNQYLESMDVDERTVLNDERLRKYKNQLNNFSPDIQDWLVNIYDEYEQHLNKLIINFLKKDDLFFLYHTKDEFRSLSYDCYADLIKRSPFIKGNAENIFKFIKEYHLLESQRIMDISSVFISQEVNDWVEQTWMKYKVSLVAFAYDWIIRFYDNKDLWPAKHKSKSKEDYIDYEYDIKQKSNLFNMNYFYRRVSNKPFLKGKKQYLEILLMYFWIKDISGDEEDYWDEYISKVIK